MAKKKTVARVAFAVFGIAVLAVAVYIMANGLGLQDDLDFGPGLIIMRTSPISKRSSTGMSTRPTFLTGSM